MEQPGYWSIIPATVRYDKRLRPNAKLLYAEISSLTNKTGKCWSTNGYFAELYGVAKETISIWINELVKYGYLKSEMTYKKGSKEIDKRYLSLVGDPINEIIKTPPKEKIETPPLRKIKDNSTSIITTSINSEVKQLYEQLESDKRIEFDNWINYRREIRKSITNNSTLKGLLKIFHNHSAEECKYIVSLSINSGWQGIFFDKVKQMKNGSTTEKTTNFERNNQKAGERSWNKD